MHRLASVNAACVILAAGASSRMGAQKLLLRLGERTLLERALDAAGHLPLVVVISPALEDRLPPGANVRVVVNPAPERGMSHSLQLANAAVEDPDAALAVLLADTPFVDAALVRRVSAALGDADVAYPVRGGVSGHPVVFAARVRPRIAGLQPGDTIRALRDDPRLQRVTVAVADADAFLDIDTPEAFAQAGRRFETSPART